ncbi:MAG: nucleoside recognition domain-containing protein [Crocinitomicaceae bacterium]
MILNYIWIGFFLVALVVATIRTFGGDLSVFGEMVNMTFEMAEVGFEISIGLTGILCLWLGIMKIGENGGSVQVLSKIVGPFFNKLFPDVPQDHPARGSMLMNFSANMLGLDNAATPMGLKAMNELQELNDKKDQATNAMIMFLVLNTSGLTLIPVTVMTYRSQYGAENPADIFIPILIATFFASLVGLITVAIYQKINLFNRVILLYLGSFTAIIIGLIWYFTSLSPDQLEIQSAFFSNLILYGIISLFIIMALRKKVNVYEAFIEGAKDGFGIAIKIIPYLVAILVSIGVFRASGAMDFLILGFDWFFGLFTEQTQFVNGLPTAFMKPLSGSGARGMMLDSFETHGVDSFVGKLTSTLQGATDTTFYIIAVYFGAVGIRKTRYAVKAGLLADLGGIVAGIIIATVWFGGDQQVVRGAKETVVQFSAAWEEGNNEKAADYLSENCILIDQTYDTLYTDRDKISGQFLSTHSSVKTQSVNLITDEAGKKRVYLKITAQKDTSSVIESFEILVENDEIKKMKYLGNF